MPVITGTTPDDGHLSRVLGLSTPHLDERPAGSAAGAGRCRRDGAAEGSGEAVFIVVLGGLLGIALVGPLITLVRGLCLSRPAGTDRRNLTTSANLVTGVTGTTTVVAGLGGGFLLPPCPWTSPASPSPS